MVFRTQCWVRSVSSNRPSSRTTRPRGALVGLFSSSSSLGGALLGLIAKSVVVVEKSLDDDDDARFKVSKMCVKKGSKIRFPIVVVVVVVVVVVGNGIVFNTSYLRTNALPRSVPTVD